VELYLHSPNTSSWRGPYLSTGTTSRLLTFTFTKFTVLWNPYVHHRVHKSEPMDPILSQRNSFHILIPDFLTNNHAMKTCWGSGGIPDGGEWSASRPGRITHWMGGWVCPRAVLDTVLKRKIPSPLREWEPRTSTFNIIQHPSLNITHGLFLSGCLNTISYTFLVFVMRATYPDYLISST